MNHNTEEWKEFKVGDVLECSTTSPLDINKREEGKIPYITRSAVNNGLSGYYGNKNKEVEGKCITIGAETGLAFYQKDAFIPGVKIYTLRHEALNYKNGLYLSTVLNTMVELYSYGRARTLEKIKDEKIKLPTVHETDAEGNRTPKKDPENKYSEEGYIPDFEWMESYIKSMNYKPLTTKVKKEDKTLEINTEEWGEFKVEALFECRIAKSQNIGVLDEGSINFVGRTAENNGIQKKVETDEGYINKGNKITVSMVGTNIAMYQSQEFVTSQNMLVLSSEKINSKNAMFITSVINEYIKGKFSYGRTIKKGEFEKAIIKLPIVYETDDEGNKVPKIDESKKYSEEGYIPDFEYMEEYIKQLPYGDRI